MNQVVFKDPLTQKVLAESKGLSYWDYTYTLEKPFSREDEGKYSVRTQKGLTFPVGNKVATVLKNYSGIGFKEWLALPQALRFLPGQIAGKITGVALYPVVATLQATMNPTLFSMGSTIGKPLLTAASFTAYSWFQYKYLFDSCFKSGKYNAWVSAKDTSNPAVAEYILTKGTGCDHNCIPNPHLVDIHPGTICAYEVTWDLAKQFPYVP